MTVVGVHPPRFSLHNKPQKDMHAQYTVHTVSTKHFLLLIKLPPYLHCTQLQLMILL